MLLEVADDTDGAAGGGEGGDGSEALAAFPDGVVNLVTRRPGLEQGGRVSAEQEIRAALVRAAKELGADGDLSPALERPRDRSFGDWSTNFAMTLARPLGRKRVSTS